MILAIDPGQKQSAWVIMTPRFRVVEYDLQPNELVGASMFRLWDAYKPACVIEDIVPRQQPFGHSLKVTCEWVGRFYEIWPGEEMLRITRAKVLGHFKVARLRKSGELKTSDAIIRQALIDRYPALGGGKTPQVGTKKNPGPLFGVSQDVWAALAVAITFVEMRNVHSNNHTL